MNQPAEHPFDTLTRWSFLPDEELAAIATPKNCSLLLEIAALLEGPNDRSIDKAGFCSVVRSMRRLYDDQSWELGETIISAETLRGQGQHIEANEILRRFIEKSPSPFYKRIARGHLEQA